MRILALDLGTHTGFAFGNTVLGLDASGTGTITLATPKKITAQGKTRDNRKSDVRVKRLWDYLHALSEKYKFDAVVWEDVQFSSSTMQTQLWSSFRTVVWLFASTNNLRTDCCPVGTLKLFATGHGGAPKESMARALKTNPRFSVQKDVVTDLISGKSLDDNAVDAVHLFYWAVRTLKNV